MKFTATGKPDADRFVASRKFVVTFAAVAGIVFLAPAFPADAALVYQKSAKDRCLSTGCLVDFGKVGRNRTLTIENVSCSLTATSKAAITRAQLVVGRSNGESLVPILFSRSNASQSYALNHNVQILAKSRKKVRIVVETDPDEPLVTVICKVTGEIEKTG